MCLSVDSFHSKAVKHNVIHLDMKPIDSDDIELKFKISTQLRHYVIPSTSIGHACNWGKCQVTVMSIRLHLIISKTASEVRMLIAASRGRRRALLRHSHVSVPCPLRFFELPSSPVPIATAIHNIKTFGVALPTHPSLSSSGSCPITYADFNYFNRNTKLHIRNARRHISSSNLPAMDHN